MITLLIKSYLTLFLAVGVGCLLMFAVGLWMIIRLLNKPAEPPADFIERIFAEEATTAASPDAPMLEEQIDDVEDTISNPVVEQPFMSTHAAAPDLSAIAGEDMVATQLDLARAYIEAGKGIIAKGILMVVVEQGNDAQQSEARNLLGLI